MTRKIKLVDFSEKDLEKIETSKKMTPQERIDLLFELIDLSNKFQPSSPHTQLKDDLPFIVVKKK